MRVYLAIWYKDPAFVTELEKEFEAWDSGKDKGYSLAEIKAEIAARKTKKAGRQSGTPNEERVFAKRQ